MKIRFCSRLHVFSEFFDSLYVSSAKHNKGDILKNAIAVHWHWIVSEDVKPQMDAESHVFYMSSEAIWLICVGQTDILFIIFTSIKESNHNRVQQCLPTVSASLALKVLFS